MRLNELATVHLATRLQNQNQNSSSAPAPSRPGVTPSRDSSSPDTDSDGLSLGHMLTSWPKDNTSSPTVSQQDSFPGEGVFPKGKPQRNWSDVSKEVERDNEPQKSDVYYRF